MNRFHEAWAKIELKEPTHKGNGSDPDATLVKGGSDPIILPLGVDKTALEQCRLTDWTPDPKTMLFFGSEESAPGQENFRSLRSRLYQVRERMPLKTVLIASSVPKEGRSFVAGNLAQAMARQQGCRVLLLDADLRSPTLHSALGTFRAPGLSEYLLGEVEEAGIIQKGPMENLFFIPSGRPVSGPSEIVSNGRLKGLLDRLAPLVDWIIVDSPAALPVSDAGLIATLCDGVLVVVRSDSTPFDVVRKARTRFPEDRLLGVVLNGIPDEPHLEVQDYRSTSASQFKTNGRWD